MSGVWKKRGTSGWETVCDLIKLTDWFWGEVEGLIEQAPSSLVLWLIVMLGSVVYRCSDHKFVSVQASIVPSWQANAMILHGLVLSRVKTCIRFDGSFFLGEW